MSELDTPAPDVSLEDLVRALKRNIELGLNVSAPANVLSYNAADQTVVVQLGFLPIAIVGGEEVPRSPTTLPPIPVGWPGSNDGYLSTPITPGCTGWVVFADRCTARWIEKGVPSDPENGRAHALADAIFLPQGRHSKNRISPATDLTATVVDGSTFIKIGRAAESFLAKADLVLAELQALKTWADTHTHTVTVAGAPLTSTPPTTPAPTPGSVACTKAKGE